MSEHVQEQVESPAFEGCNCRVGATLQDGSIWSVYLSSCPLHSAAPKLLAALEGLIPTEHCGWVCAQFKDEIAAAKAAIKEAKGES